MATKRINLRPALSVLGLVLAVTVGAAGMPGLACADIQLYERNGFTLNLNLDLGAATFVVDNANFGAGNSRGEQSLSWSEGYLKPVLGAAYSSAVGELYGGFSYVAGATLGDGDPAEFTDDDSDGFESEQLYGGIATDRLAGLGIDRFDFSVGEQEFTIGDGFLIWDGEFDSRYGAYWLNPHLSFKNSVIARADSGPFHGDLFYLVADEDSGDTELYGLNLEAGDEQLGTVGMTFLKVADVDRNGDYGLRDGMTVYSVRAQGTPLARAGQDALFLAFEYVHQGGGDVEDIDADAWYLEAGYTLAELPWTPTLSYKYAFFSGDENPVDGRNQAFDPLFYGMGRGWGSHIMGEIVGEYYLFNSNQQVHMLGVGLQPTEALAMGVLFYDFFLDEKTLYGTPVADDHFAREIDLYADYCVSDNLFLSATLAWAGPEAGGEDYFASGDDSYLAQLAVFVNF